MRFVFVALLVITSFTTSAQDGADRITISKFDKPKDIALLDTIKNLLLTGAYTQFISEEKEIYNKASKTNNFSDVKKLLNKLSSNGSEDVSQCFYPRHSINYYKDGRLIKYVLICFECYGVRFSDERWVTRVGNEQKRIKLMDELKAHFSSLGLN